MRPVIEKTTKESRQKKKNKKPCAMLVLIRSFVSWQRIDVVVIEIVARFRVIVVCQLGIIHFQAIVNYADDHVATSEAHLPRTCYVQTVALRAAVVDVPLVIPFRVVQLDAAATLTVDSWCCC